MRIYLPMVLGVLLWAPEASQASPLDDAAKAGDVAAIAAALDGGADVNETIGRTTALFDAAANGHQAAVELLIQRGADLDLPGRFGKTPLQVASTKKNGAIVSLLLSNGAKPDAVTSGLTPLQIAADDGCLECVESLVGAGADVNLLTSEGSPAIHFAKLKGHEDVVAFLRDHGAEKLVLPSIAVALANAQPKVGEEIFRENCGLCHRSLSELAKGSAPPLWNLLGRQRGSVEGFEYSDAMKDDAETWTYDTLNAFIFNPTWAVPGITMQFSGLQDEAKRADVIVYLRTLSDAPLPLPAL